MQAFVKQAAHVPLGRTLRRGQNLAAWPEPCGLAMSRQDQSLLRPVRLTAPGAIPRRLSESCWPDTRPQRRFTDRGELSRWRGGGCRSQGQLPIQPIASAEITTSPTLAPPRPILNSCLLPRCCSTLRTPCLTVPSGIVNCTRWSRAGAPRFRLPNSRRTGKTAGSRKSIPASSSTGPRCGDSLATSKSMAAFKPNCWPQPKPACDRLKRGCDRSREFLKP